ncbi:M20 family metallopeptidase [Halolamina sp.]|jgi:succinyl-diaminopimelate desuccinylase|uniref:M20 family metallopeptidase n=1 Tax=Halolamina sp. TaxID=1940283 RepID=UPI000223BAAD|nr:acetylornithine deacetylase or succinyl-diaminopimelate desuccinylase [halophilic archaeon DL31]
MPPTQNSTETDAQIDDNLTELIAELVSRESENPPGNEAPVAEFIHGWFADRGIDAELVEDPYADRPQVAARVGEGEPTVVVNGHIDVVPAGKRSEWSHDPYGADVVDAELYGRGSVDMKTGVAVAMRALADLEPELSSGEIDGSLVFHAAIGEETAEPGTKRLLELGYDGEYGIVLEPTELRTATSEKGLAWYEITVTGDPSHASRPDQGTNAIQKARPVLDALAEYDDRVRERTDPLVGQAYATVTEFNAGTKENVVPEEAVITVDRRFLPEESAERIDAEFEELLSAVAEGHDVEVSWERTRTYESAAIPTDSRIAEVVRGHSAVEGDVPTEPWGVKASTDVRNLVNDAGMEAVTWGPGDLAQAHTYDEHVDLAEATTGLTVLKASLRELWQS